MAESVRIIDVSPRDGLQNEVGFVPTADKARLVRAVAAAGVDEVEATSFVSRRWVPQLGDAEALGELLAADPPRSPVSALVPNEQGLRAVLDLHQRVGRVVFGTLSVFAAASETFSLRNTNGSIAAVLARFESVIGPARRAGLSVRGYISCVVACPFEGPIAPTAVARVAAELVRMGVGEVALGDTIGAGTPEAVDELLRHVARVTPLAGGDAPVALHLHDTMGTAAACVVAGLRSGVRAFDGAAGGLGGCPYAARPGRRAPGNIDAELLVATIHAAGYRTAVDLDRLRSAAGLARGLVSLAQQGAGGGPA